MNINKINKPNFKILINLLLLKIKLICDPTKTEIKIDGKYVYQTIWAFLRGNISENERIIEIRINKSRISPDFIFAKRNNT